MMRGGRGERTLMRRLIGEDTVRDKGKSPSIVTPDPASTNPTLIPIVFLNMRLRAKIRSWFPAFR